jgi:hypothetical protein
MELESLRLLERILDSIIGGLAIYLGYLLFLKVPQYTDGEGKITLPHDVSIYLARVGPGVFFALFGTGVVTASLYHGITYDVNSTPSPSGLHQAAATATTAAIHFSGLGTVMEGDAAHQQLTAQSACASVQQLIVMLNRLPAALRPDLRAQQRADIENAVPRIKLAVMNNTWTERWGDPAAFSDWVLDGANGTVPQGLEQAADCFNQGSQPP